MIVTDIGYGQWLDAPAAASFFRVCAAIGRRLDVNEAGRTWAQQNAFRQAYLNGTGAFALPAGQSIHEQGRAIDTDDRFIELMADHGWVRTALARNEPWHFEYFIEQDNHRHEGIPAGYGSSTPFPTTPSAPPIDYALLRRQKETTMYVRGTSDSNSVYNLYTDAQGKGHLRLCPRGEAAAALAGGLVIRCDDETLVLIAKEGRYYDGADTSAREAVWLDTKVQRFRRDAAGEVVKDSDGKAIIDQVPALQELADIRSEQISDNLAEAVTPPKS